MDPSTLRRTGGRRDTADAEPIFASVLDTPTVNITCRHQHGDRALDAADQPVELPLSFFVDLDAFGADKGGWDYSPPNPRSACRATSTTAH